MTGTRGRRAARVTAWVALVLALLAGAYLLAGFLLVPRLILRELPRVEERLGVRITLDELRTNPVLLRLDLAGVSVTHPDGKGLLEAERGHVDLAWSGLFARRWEIAELVLERAHLQLTRGKDGAFVLPRPAEPQGQAAEDAQADAPRAPPPFVLHRLSLRESRLTLHSEAAPDKPVIVEGFSLEGENFSSNGEDEAGRYRLAAMLPGGGNLVVEGEAVISARTASGKLALADAPVAPWWPLLGQDLALSPPQGKLSVGADYQADFGEDRRTLVFEPLSLRADGLVLARPDVEVPLLSMALVEVTGGRLEMLRQQLRLEGVRFARGRVSVTVGEDGRVDWARLRKSPTPRKREGGAWHVLLPATRLEEVAIRYRELAPPGRRFDTDRAHAKADLTLDAESGGFRIAGLEAELRQPAYAAGDAAPLLANRLDLQGGSLDTAKRTLGADRAVLTGSRVEVFIDTDGKLVLPGGLGTGKAKPAEKTGPTPNPWRYALGELHARALDVSFADKREDMPIALRGRGEFRLKGFESGRAEPLGFDARLQPTSGGDIQVQGNAAYDGSRTEANLKVSAVRLTPAAELFARHTTLRLADGKLYGNLKIVHSRTRKPALKTEGDVRLGGLRLDEADSGEKFFSARSIDARGRLQLGPGALRLDRVTFDKPEARLIIDAQRKLNLADVIRKRQQSDRPKPEKPDATARGPAFDIRVDRIEVRHGELEFADLSLLLPFSTQVTELGGNILGVDNRHRSEAVLDLQGSIEPHGEARAEGRLRPFAITEFTDVRVRFDNVALPLLTPYSATFAGRTIAAGRLWLDVRYRIDERELDGLNAITLRDFRLGERVQERGRSDLPLELALALLKQPDGSVHLEVPVKGTVDDARFGFRELVFDAIGNVLRRIVTAPFRFLGRLVGLGRDDDEFKAVPFEPGSARLTPENEEKLGQLAQALAQRPQLVLGIRPGYVADEDEQALQEQAARRVVAEAAGSAPGPGRVGPLDFSDPAVRRAVRQEFEATAGKDALRAFRDEYAQREGGEEPADAQLHRELFGELKRMLVLPGDALPELARRRAGAVREFLGNAGIGGERVRTADAEPLERGHPRAELELEVGPEERE